MEKRVSKLSITTDDLERRENLAKRLNRTATNRLRQQHEQFQGNHEFVENEIKQEIKRIQDDLKGIREIGNYNIRNSTHEINQPANNSSVGMKRKKFTLFQRKAKTNSRRKLNRHEGGRKVKFYPENSSQVISLDDYKTAGDLFNLSRNEKQTKNTQTRDISTQHDDEHGVSGRETQTVGHKRTLYEHEERLDRHKTQLVGHERRTNENETRSSDKHETLPRITKSATQESGKSCELDVHEARNQARKRLLGENEQLLDENEPDSNTQNEQETTSSNEEIEAYMYVPPDGRKRTVYLLPPLEELLQEAGKARYLRMPKRLTNYEDDPERELSIDEIFSKNV
jgi:hypothetical protein